MRPTDFLRSWPAVALSALLLFGSGFALGQSDRFSGAVDLPESRDLELDNFWKVKRLIEQRYPRDVDADALSVGATKGLVEGLNDPYSSFLTKEEADQLDQSLAGSVEGIGVEIGERDGQIVVIAPLPASPALAAGIKSGDVILGVEGAPIAGQELEEVVKKIRGPKGSQVKLDVRTPAEPPRQLTLTRDTVKAASVELAYRGDIAVLEVSRFGDDTKADLDRVIADIQAKRPRGVVLDLRSNPGGYLEGAIDLASVFLRDGVVVKEQLASGRSEERRVQPPAPLADVPLVVLVNKGSASASEIVAGALRDNNRAKLVGEQTFGKGSVQDLIGVADGTILKLTIAEWLTPNGTSISEQGLKPDTEVPSTDPNAQLDAAIRQITT